MFDFDVYRFRHLIELAEIDQFEHVLSLELHLASEM